VIRLFVALELPAHVREALAALEFDEEVWRRVAPQSLHVTLAFLGARPEADVEAIRPLIVPGPAPDLALGKVLLLPPRRARVLTVALDDPSGALAELQARLSAGLERLGVYTPEQRAFRAHITVGRLRPRVKPPRSTGLALEPLRFPGESVTLFQSTLHPSGARYEPLATAALTAG
jgi:2'-5' RNA ligase